MRLRRFVVPLVFDALAFSVSAKATAQDKAAGIDDLLSKYHDFGLFNGAVLVAHDGEVIHKRGYGLANMEWGVPNTTDTKYRIGSVTKQFTAALVLQLVEEGKIALDEPITTYLPEYPAKQGKRVTIHHLLVHTSGIPSYTGLPSMREVEDTGYDHYEDVIEKRATGYVRAGSGYYQHPRFLHSSVPYAAGMMYSTVEDLYKWDQALYGDGLFETAETKALWFGPHVDVPGEEKAGYGYGWIVREAKIGDAAVDVIEHGGGIYGFATGFWRMPDELNPGLENAKQMLKKLGVEVEKKSIELSEDVLESFVGEYALQPNFVLTITRDGRQMYVQATGQPRAEMYPASENRFYLKAVDAQLTFNRDEEGGVTSLVLHQNGQNMPAERVE